ncbi:hypothetical protein LEP1GSC036_1822 [Leptospira weilii str. 2006001853]|uniref:Uncharacterized protein n=3 Tax=Leptospira weilii TaxID=28184 RepID=A0A828YWN0_9LEPT|nr:hypothetical protein LEP1GSC036_1822 [Leptospira weilii str. 2006001853]EMM72561.1 hypothetical protein LEP1GSC038_0550 [Leptospira weilii str. 2006001855]EMN44574.1 hypothetical protein LEP1GSC086_1997 [Leptospira weilii str. LNT 1234]EMN92203.1 hypothetical protein LEP1GSC108_3844 [Leptospira weilii str. UI 13098]
MALFLRIFLFQNQSQNFPDLYRIGLISCFSFDILKQF